MARSFVVFSLAFAGIWLLAGAGWALLAGAVLVCVLWRREPDWGPVVSRARGYVQAARRAPRRVIAAGSMAAAVVLLAAGFALAVGTGAGLVAGGVSVAGVSLLTGWGA